MSTYRPTAALAHRPSARHALLLPFAALLALALLLAGCGEADDQGQLEIIGSYTDEFGGDHEVTAQTWDSSGGGFTLLFNILVYSNAEDYLVAQNDSANDFNPDLFSRFSWTTFNADLYFCQNPFDAADAGDALQATPPDSTDPGTGGCGGFAWTNLTP